MILFPGFEQHFQSSKNLTPTVSCLPCLQFWTSKTQPQQEECPGLLLLVASLPPPKLQLFGLPDLNDKSLGCWTVVPEFVHHFFVTTSPEFETCNNLSFLTQTLPIPSLLGRQPCQETTGSGWNQKRLLLFTQKILALHNIL